MITIINLSENTTNLPNTVVNWNEINESTKEFMLNGTHYRIYSSQELLIYNERKVIASCSISCLENGKIEIENCWNKEGKLY